MSFTFVLTRLCSCFSLGDLEKGLGESLSEEFVIYISVFCIRQAWT